MIKSALSYLRFTNNLSNSSGHLFLVIYLFFCSSNCPAQENIPPFIYDSIQANFNRSPFTDQQKVYLHIDRPYYASGETIWFKAYLVKAATNQFDYRSGVLNVEVVDPERTIIISNQHKLSAGITSGSINLPDSLVTAQYTLRAYTNWMRNFDPSFYWTKAVKIAQVTASEEIQTAAPEYESDTDLKFYPEGGYLLNGIPCQIAFKATNEAGEGVDISGEVIDSDGTKVSTFNSIHQGMGSFFLTPWEGKEFQAVVNGTTYALPDALSKGLVMFAYTENIGTIRVHIRGSKDFEDRYFHLIGQTNGVIQYTAAGKLKDQQALAIIDTEDLSPGVLQLTLFDQLGRPQAERLLFIHPNEVPNMVINIDRDDCEPRQNIEVEIGLNDHQKRGIASELSIAITDPSQVQIPLYADNIYSHSYLTSDLEGFVSAPGYYLKDRNKQTQRALDVLLLTQGWRRFTWKEVMEGPGKLPFTFKRGITLSGLALNRVNDQPIKNGQVSLIPLEKNNALHLGFTDSQGRFKFEGLDLYAEQTGVIKVKNEKGKSIASRIILDSLSESAVIPSFYPDPINFLKDESFIAKAKTRREIDIAFDTTNTKHLDSVVVSAERDNTFRGTKLHAVADAVIKNDGPNYGTIFDLLRGKVAGLEMISRNGITSMIIRNRGTPLVLLNDIPLNPAFFGVSPEDLYLDLLSIHPTDVDRIEVLKTLGSASSYGAQGAAGVVAIYTKGGHASISKDPRITEVKLPGYFWEREFFAPDYQGDLKNHPKPDHRVTLDWQPSIQTDSTGKTSFSFYNSDIACDLDIIVQGLSKDGRPIFAVFNSITE